LQNTNFFKCKDCGYEFLSNAKEPTCPKCKGKQMEKKDIGQLGAFDE